MESKKIEDYAVIGDCETAALVSRDGAIDWLCWPDFSSPACFAALLGSGDNGHWTLAPRDKQITATRRYQPHTLVLDTTFETSSGTIVMTDFMPIRGHNSDLVRVVRCISGTVQMDMTLCLRFDYGKSVPWIECESGPNAAAESVKSWVARVGPNLTVFRSAATIVESSPGTLSAEFTLHAGETQNFALTYGCSYEAIPAPIDVVRALRETVSFWTDWAAQSQYKGPYSEAVERSLITLKAMTYRPSGGIVAAVTTSLPERLGGPLNWDYRFCWIRDATLTLSALLEAGYTEEVIAWKKWLIRAIGPDASQVQIMYGITGERSLAETEIDWLPGYAASAPVRVGNAAQKQIQQDIYGEIAAALFHAREAGIAPEPHELELQKALTEHLAKIWQEPGSGMWEERNHPERFTFSGVMAWLALDRAVKSIEQHGMGGPLEEWKALRDRVRADVFQHGFDVYLDTFVQHYGSSRLDASVLLLPIFGFLPADDPRMLGTVKAVERELMKDGLLLRNLPATSKAEQGAFLACSFWLVEIYAMLGRFPEATKLFEKLLGLANDVGLLSEEYDTDAARLTGNFPQAFSHIALVHAAVRLAGCPH
jgi:GH15 family glucan-1,4-alpha-glucosidase